MKIAALCFFLLASQAQAQPSGPIVRDLGSNYYLVQCNSVKLEADDVVAILRQGHEVGIGKVMRSDSSACSILLTGGEARRLDLVFLTRRNTIQGDRGPGLPTALVTSPRGQSSKAPTSKPAGGFFGSIQASGSVYNLNTGEYLTKP